MDHRYCPQCGGGLQFRLLDPDPLERLVCISCDFIFYQNPKVVVGAIPRRGRRVALVRRGIEPRLGTWTFPAGFLEMGETVEEAACRETLEECNLEVRIDELLNVYSRPTIGIVNIVYLATITGGTFLPNLEATEYAEFAPEDVPWDDLAFDTTRWALRDWMMRLGTES